MLRLSTPSRRLTRLSSTRPRRRRRRRRRPRRRRPRQQQPPPLQRKLPKPLTPRPRTARLLRCPRRKLTAIPPLWVPPPKQWPVLAMRMSRPMAEAAAARLLQPLRRTRRWTPALRKMPPMKRRRGPLRGRQLPLGTLLTPRYLKVFRKTERRTLYLSFSHSFGQFGTQISVMPVHLSEKRKRN